MLSTDDVTDIEVSNQLIIPLDTGGNLEEGLSYSTEYLNYKNYKGEVMSIQLDSLLQQDEQHKVVLQDEVLQIKGRYFQDVSLVNILTYIIDVIDPALHTVKAIELIDFKKPEMLLGLLEKVYSAYDVFMGINKDIHITC